MTEDVTNLLDTYESHWRDKTLFNLDMNGILLRGQKDMRKIRIFDDKNTSMGEDSDEEEPFAHKEVQK